MKQEDLPIDEPQVQKSKIAVDGVSISPTHWYELTGEQPGQLVRLIRLPDELTNDEKMWLRIGKAVCELRNGLGYSERIEIWGKLICMFADGNEVSVNSDDFAWDDEAGQWERLAEKARGGK